MNRRALFTLFACSFLLTGCFGSDETSTTTTADPNAKTFAIGNNSWGLQLTDGWETIAVPTGKDAVFLARNDSENMVIIQREAIAGQNPSQVIWDEAKKDFPYFTEIAFADSAWQFEAKRTSRRRTEMCNNESCLSQTLNSFCWPAVRTKSRPPKPLPARKY